MAAPNEETRVRPSAFHFWDLNTAAAYKISILAQSPDTYEGMDTVVNAWDNVVYMNFPQDTAHRDGDYYIIELRRHEGAWGDGWGRSIVVQLIDPDWRFEPGSVPGLPPLPEMTDVAWVELAAPDKAKSRGKWRDLMRVAVERLAEQNPGRRLLLILVAGFRWMPFMWDPVEPLHPERGPVVMKGDGEDERWPVDPRVYMIAREGEAGASSLVFDPLEAYTLDFWTQDEFGAVVNRKNLLWLEELLTGARRPRPKALAATEEVEPSTAKE